MKSLKKIVLGVFVFCMAAMAVLTVPNVVTAAEQSTIEGIQRRGTLRVGFSSFVPWAMQNTQGEYIGFEIDVARRLAKDLGVELQLVPTSWDGIIPALLSGKFDVIIGGMGATVSRGMSVNFTIPYYNTTQDIVVNKERAGHVKSLEDLNNSSTIIATRTGSSSALLVKKILPEAQIRYFNDEATAVQEVLNGRADAFISAIPLPALEALKSPDKLFQPFKIEDHKEPISFAVKKGDLDTLNVFDTWIRQVSGEGWLDERYEYWFEGNEWETN